MRDQGREAGREARRSRMTPPGGRCIIKPAAAQMPGDRPPSSRITYLLGQSVWWGETGKKQPLNNLLRLVQESPRGV